MDCYQKKGKLSLDCHLICMIFHIPSSTHEYDSDFSKDLYNALLCKLRNNVFDATCDGRSNGETTYENSNILSLLRSNTAFIRKGKGSIQ